MSVLLNWLKIYFLNIGKNIVFFNDVIYYYKMKVTQINNYVGQAGEVSNGSMVNNKKDKKLLKRGVKFQQNVENRVSTLCLLYPKQKKHLGKITLVHSYKSLYFVSFFHNMKKNISTSSI